MMLAAAYATWCALCWRLRGGLISNVTRRFGYTMSTGETRAACTLLMALPLAWLGWWTLVVIPFLFAAMTLPYFDKSMGLTERGRDHFYLALWGVAVAALSLAPLAWHNPWVLLNALGGILFMVAYAVNKPLGGKWTERAECCVGFLLGILLWVSVHG